MIQRKDKNDVEIEYVTSDDLTDCSRLYTANFSTLEELENIIKQHPHWMMSGANREAVVVAGTRIERWHKWHCIDMFDNARNFLVMYSGSATGTMYHVAYNINSGWTVMLLGGS